MSTANGVERRAFQACYADVSRVIGKDPSMAVVATKAYAKLLIPEATCSMVCNSFLPVENRASALLSALEAQIRLNARTFWTFVGILEEESSYGYLVKKLEQQHETVALDNPTIPRIERTEEEEEVSMLSNSLRWWYRTNPYPPIRHHTPGRKYLSSKTLQVLNRSYGYTNLVLHETHTGESVMLEDILQPKEVPKYVLLLGRRGIGKTAAAWEVCQRWGKSNIKSARYSAVLFCDLCSTEIQNAKSLTDLCASRAYDHQMHKSVEEIHLSHGTSTLLIFDGTNYCYDHCLDSSSSSNSLFRKCLSGKYLKYATILVACAPNIGKRIEEIIRVNGTPGDLRKLTILGFQHSGVSNYIENYASFRLPMNKKAYDTFVAFLQNSQFREIMKIPLNCAAITEYFLAYRNPEEDSCEQNVKMLTYLTLMHLQHRMDNGMTLKSQVASLSADALPSPLNTRFRSLCLKAWEYVNAPCKKLDESIDTDLLPIPDESYEHYFQCRPIVTFFAAIHIALHSELGLQLRAFEISLNDTSALEAADTCTSHAADTWRFVPPISQLFTATNTGTVPSEMKTLYENCKKQVQAVCDHNHNKLALLVKACEDGMLKNSRIGILAKRPFEEHDFGLIGDLMKNDSALLELDFSHGSLLNGGLKNLMQHCYHRSTYISVLDLSNNTISQEQLHELQAQDTALCGLVELKLSNCLLTATSCEHLASQSLLENMHHLKVLNISENPDIGGKGVIAKVIASLLRMRFLQVLDFRNINMNSDDVAAVAWLLLTSATLKWLDISQSSGLEAHSFDYISRSLQLNKGTALTTLKLSGLKFDPERTIRFVEIMKNNTTITELDVSNCGIDHSCVDILDSDATDIGKNKTLQTLNLVNNPICSSNDGPFTLIRHITASVSLQCIF